MNDNFREYLETSLLAKKVKMAISKILLQKSYELGVGIQNYTLEFTTVNRLIDWLEISLVYDKSDKHATIYSSYNLERASVFIQNDPIEVMS